MARGIHLKRLSNNHLEILGVHDAFPENDDTGNRNRTEAADSLVGTATGEVRDCLEETLILLQQALDATTEHEDGFSQTLC